MGYEFAIVLLMIVCPISRLRTDQLRNKQTITKQYTDSSTTQVNTLYMGGNVDTIIGDYNEPSMSDEYDRFHIIIVVSHHPFHNRNTSTCRQERRLLISKLKMTDEEYWLAGETITRHIYSFVYQGHCH